MFSHELSLRSGYNLFVLSKTFAILKIRLSTFYSILIFDYYSIPYSTPPFSYVTSVSFVIKVNISFLLNRTKSLYLFKSYVPRTV